MRFEDSPEHKKTFQFQADELHKNASRLAWIMATELGIVRLLEWLEKNLKWLENKNI